MPGVKRGEFYPFVHGMAASLLALAGGAPPVHDINRLRGTFGTNYIVVSGVFDDGDIMRLVLGDEREVRQVDLVDLVEDCLASGGIGSLLLLSEELIQSRVAVEGIIASTIAIGSGWDLTAGKDRRIVTVIDVGFLELG